MTDVNLVIAFAVLAYGWIALSRWLARTSGEGSDRLGGRAAPVPVHNRIKDPGHRAARGPANRP